VKAVVFQIEVDISKILAFSKILFGCSNVSIYEFTWHSFPMWLFFYKCKPKSDCFVTFTKFYTTEVKNW